MKNIFSALFVGAIVVAFYACRPASTDTHVLGGYSQNGGNSSNGKVGQETQNSNSGNSSSNGKVGQETQNGGDAVDPNWKMPVWLAPLCKCAGTNLLYPEYLDSKLSGLCWMEKNKPKCVAECTKLMQDAGGASAQGCPSQNTQAPVAPVPNEQQQQQQNQSGKTGSMSNSNSNSNQNSSSQSSQGPVAPVPVEPPQQEQQK